MIGEDDRPRQTWLATIRRDMWQFGIELDASTLQSLLLTVA